MKYAPTVRITGDSCAARRHRYGCPRDGTGTASMPKEIGGGGSNLRGNFRECFSHNDARSVRRNRARAPKVSDYPPFLQPSFRETREHGTCHETFNEGSSSLVVKSAPANSRAHSNPAAIFKRHQPETRFQTARRTPKSINSVRRESF